MQKRFSILTLLSVTAVFAAFFAGRMPLVERTRIAEQQATDAIAKLNNILHEEDVWIGDTRYHLQSLVDALANAPEWKNKSNPPPLDLMEAIEVCRDIARTINSYSAKTKISNWTLESIALAPLDFDEDCGFEANKWIYCAEFQGFEQDAYVIDNISLIILMDKTVLATDGPFRDILLEHYEYLPNQ